MIGVNSPYKQTNKNTLMRGKRKLLKDRYIKSTNDFDRIKTAFDKGGKLEVIQLWNKIEYWFNHIEGGREKINKRIYLKLSK